MPNDTQKTSSGLDALGLPADPEALRAAAAVMQERLRLIEEEAAKRLAAEQAALEAKPPPDPLVEVEWLKTTQKYDCFHANRYYKGQGPVIHKPTGRVLKPGEKAQLPADAARVFAEAGYVRVVAGLEHIRWTPFDGAPAVNAAHPDPADARAWEALSHS